MARRLPLVDLIVVGAVGLLALLAVLILVGPVLVVLLTSLTTSASLRFPPPALSLQWYAALLDPVQSSHIHAAAWNSLQVALYGTAAATIVTVMAALALARSPTRTARGLDTMFMSPLVLPMMAYGLAALMFFTLLGFRPTLTHLVVAHALVIAPFVLRTTTASLSQLDRALLESSSSLGASPWFTFRRVTLPLIMPGIAAGAILAFIASLDNVPVSLFLSTARTDMLPIRMWGMMESTLDVRVAAVSGVLIAVVLVLMLVMERLVGLTRRVRG